MEFWDRAWAVAVAIELVAAALDTQVEVFLIFLRSIFLSVSFWSCAANKRSNAAASKGCSPPSEEDEEELSSSSLLLESSESSYSLLDSSKLDDESLSCAMPKSVLWLSI